MDCPHCHEALPTQTCPACERPALTGAGYCHHCGHLLPAPAAEPPKLLTCDSCGRPALPAANYCPGCGHELAAGPAPAVGEDAPDFTERVACSDGLCIGIIGPDGRCTECGKPYQPEGGEA